MKRILFLLLLTLFSTGLANNIEYGRCPFDLPEGEKLGETIRCGHLLVPSSREDPKSHKIRLAFAILYAQQKRNNDTVIYLDGGPGGATLRYTYTWTTSLLRKKHDLILFDQRGTGYSFPVLDCKEVDGINNPKAYRKAKLSCLNRLKQEGIITDHYNSRENASDVADLLKALKLKNVNLYGVSYGARLALTIMRDHPEGIRSAVLDSAYPPNVEGFAQWPMNMQRAFNQLFADCWADENCHKAYPNLEADFYAMLQNLSKKPYSLGGNDKITALDYADALFTAMYDIETISDLPLTISIATKGSLDISYLILQDIWNDDYFAEGTFTSFNCYEEAPFQTAQMIKEFNQGVHPSLRQAAIENAIAGLEFCKLWSKQNVDKIENEAVVSDIPTLVLAGSLDPVTPPASGKLAAKSLSHSQFVLFPGMGHGLIHRKACPDQIIANFLDYPERFLDISCAAKMKTVFAIPE